MKTAVSVVCCGLLATGLLGTGAGCDRCTTAPGSPPPAASPAPVLADGEFSVMTFNLNRYALSEGSPEQPTLEQLPPPETRHLIDVIRRAAPDILAVQEMGDPAAWADFKIRLRNSGLAYDYEEYLRASDEDLNIAVLSRFPITAHHSHTEDRYTIGPRQFPMQRGLIEVDIAVRPDYTLRLLAAHLKSNRFHPYGQAEMRRNEARLLNNHVRASLEENPEINLLVVGDLNATPGSALFRDITTYQDEPILFDLRPVDAAGDAWTVRESNDTCQRVDYMLAAEGLLPEAVLDKTIAIRDRSLLAATDHRPLLAVFRATEADNESTPDLDGRLPPDIPEND